MFEALLLFCTLILSTFLTGMFRRYALKKDILDIPNQRSSHEHPTPCGGGLAMVVSFLLALIILLFLERLAMDTFLALAGGGGLIALTGALDDYHSLKASLRLPVHFGAAAWGLYWLGGLPEMMIGPYLFDPGLLGNLAGLVFLVWLLNLFNFMDGIDGIAASEAVFVSGAAALLTWYCGGRDTLLLLLFALSCLGFLFWNWPPARIFMGDAGSGFLGIILGLLAIKTTQDSETTIWTWLILTGLFIVDATLTLLRRIVSGKTWYKAHRSHCYQILARRWQSHRKVTVLFVLINGLWLLPLACLSALLPSRGLMITAFAWLPLACFMYLAGAGRERS